MIKFKLYEIKKIADSFNKLIEQDLPIDVSWALMQIAESFVDNEEKYNKLYNKIQEKFVVQEDEKMIIPNESIENFKSELETLNNIGFEINVEKIKMDDIKKYVKLSVIDLMKLKKIIIK